MDINALLQEFSGLKDVLFGIPIVVVVLALVQWIKATFALQGKQVEIVSLIVGLVLGIGYRCTQTIELTFAWFFMTFIYGLVLGIIPSQLYKVGQDVVQGAVTKANALLDATKK